eukprot:scaffold11.g4022.t1
MASSLALPAAALEGRRAPPLRARRLKRGPAPSGATAVLRGSSDASTSTSTTAAEADAAAAATSAGWGAAPEVGQAGVAGASPLVGKQLEEAAMHKQIALHEAHPRGVPLRCPLRWGPKDLEAAFDKCGLVTSEYAKTFYLGTQLMTPEKARAIWAIYVWCRRTDELVDGPNASKITPAALDRWEERLEALFEGRPYDSLDAALTDTISKFPLDIQPFRDMIGGMRMDLVKSRYESYDELYDYCYRVAGTVALMSVPVMGGPLEPVYRAALALGTANQLTNILRDVGEDATQRNRVYVPLDELADFGIGEGEVVRGMFAASTGKIDDRWRAFMGFQIERARALFADAESGVNLLDKDARWPVWSALVVYRQILDAIEANGYNNFTMRAYVSKAKKLLLLPVALAYAQVPGLQETVTKQRAAA